MQDAQKEAAGTPVIGYDRELQEITQIIERAGSGAPEHIAIVAGPMGGRTTIVTEIRRMFADRVQYVPLEFVITPSTLPDISTMEGDILLIDNCRFLATRKIGGFDVLETFLHAQIASKKLIITTWNVFSWQYLSAVMNLDAFFPRVVVLPTMDTPVLKQVILSRYRPGEIRFLDDGASERSMFYSVIHRKIRLPSTGTEIQVPWIKLNFTVMLHRFPRRKRIQVAIDDIVFEKINRIARGNPGVAFLLWDASLKDTTISPGAITETPYTIDPDINESFILSIILSMESLHEKDLVAIAGSEMDVPKVLYHLVQQNLLVVDAGYYSIPPFALGPVAEYLKKTRRLW